MTARRLKSATLLAAFAGLAAAAPAPASAAPPRAADFSQPVPAAEQLRAPTAASLRRDERRGTYGTEGPVLYRSIPARTDRRFDMVGVAGEMHALEFRTRSDEGPWSDWVETDNGDPAYTGGADAVQVRSRGVPIEGRLYFIRLRDSSVAPRPLKRVPGSARAGSRRGPPEPRYVSRAVWGANSRTFGCQPRQKPQIGRIAAGAIHHTVSTNSYSREQAPGIVLGICRYHRNANGWNDIGYNALADRFGTLYEGRDGGLARPIVGAQAEGVNSLTTGIASIGDHSAKGAPTHERRTIVRYLAWKFAIAGIRASGKARLISAGGSTSRGGRGDALRVPRVFSHSDTNFTECAGDKLRRQIPSIRRGVQRRLNRFSGASPRR